MAGSPTRWGGRAAAEKEEACTRRAGTGMVQVRVTAIPEVPIHGSSGFSRFRYRLDAGIRRRETIEFLK